MCVELPLGGKAGRRHPCDGGCRLDWKPKDKVLNVWRSTGNWLVLHSTSLVSDTGNSISVISRVRGQGDHVKSTSPDTENHDKNGYVKLYDDKNLFMTTVDNNNSDTAYTNKHKNTKYNVRDTDE